MSVLDNATKLLKNGYQVIPLYGNSVPCVKGHLSESVWYNEKDVVEWRSKFPDAGVGLVAGKANVCMLDVDIDLPVERLAHQIRRVLQKHWPSMPVRTCNAPRFAVLFRASEDLQEYTNAHSGGCLVDGEINQLEFIGHRVCTLYGRHRSSGKRYKWGHNSPLNTLASDLPELSAKDVQSIFNFFENRIPEEFTKKGRSSFSQPRGGDGFDNIKLTRVYSDEAVADLLSQIKGDSRNNWLKVGTALHHNYKASKKGFQIWNAWAEKFRGYQGVDDQKYQWNSFKIGGGVTVRTLEKALENTKKTSTKKESVGIATSDPEAELARWLKEKVSVERKDWVADIGRKPFEALSTHQELKRQYAHYKVPIKVRDGRSGAEKTKYESLYNVWYTHPLKRLAYAVEWFPVCERLIEGGSVWAGERDQIYYNRYVPPWTKRTSDTDLLPVFLDHMQYLFPDQDDCNWIINWIAQMVQRPEKRFAVSPLSISTYHGTGRGWLSLILEQLVGPDNATTISSIKEIIRPGAKSGFLNESILCQVTETHVQGHEKYELDTKLKKLLGDSKQHVDIKYGEESSKIVYTRMFFQSNHLDALHISDKDRRIEVFLNTAKPKSDEYYEHIYEVLDGDNNLLDQIYTYLSNIKVRTSWLQRSRNTDARTKLIQATKSDTANAFLEFRLVVKAGVFTESMMNTFISDYFTTNILSENSMGAAGINNKELRRLQKDELAFTHRIKLKGKPVLVHAFTPIDLSEVTPKAFMQTLRDSDKNLKHYFVQAAEHRHN